MSPEILTRDNLQAYRNKVTILDKLTGKSKSFTIAGIPMEATFIILKNRMDEETHEKKA